MVKNNHWMDEAKECGGQPRHRKSLPVPDGPLEKDNSKSSIFPRTRPLKGKSNFPDKKLFPARPLERARLPLELALSPGLLRFLDPIVLCSLPRLDDQSGASKGRAYHYGTRGQVVKVGHYIQEMEAITMAFVGFYTDIPVPQVYMVREATKDEEGLLVTEYVEGEQLNQVWDDLTATERDDIVSTVADYILQLRRLRFPYIGALDGKGVPDPFFHERGSRACYSEEAFLEMLVALVEREVEGSDDTDEADDAVAGLRRLPREERSFPMTHGSLNARNILVKDGRVTAVVGWNASGIYPSWWEVCKTGFFSQQEFARRLLLELEPCYEQRDVMDQVRDVVHFYDNE